VNEKAREAAYALLVSMGERMTAGGKVVQSKVPGMPADAPTVDASLEEYFTMVSAGLAGSTPHMISASITAVTRILYEFHAQISRETTANLLEVMDIFLQNPNREIVRSVLGFVKVQVVSLPENLVRPRLAVLLKNLLVWSHEHKAQFKVKVKHIIERMVRRYGVEAVERACPPEDRKLITNIRKTRDARKKKKSANGADEMDEDVQEAGTTQQRRKGKFESEFDEAVYGSEDSDSDEGGDSEDDFVKSQSQKVGGRRGKETAKSYIVEDEDEPLDLLSKRALGNISSTKPLRQRQTPKKLTKAKMDVDGKLILGGEDDDEDGVVKMKKGGKKEAHAEEDTLMDIDDEGTSLEQGINAYVDAIRGKDAAQRGQKGKLKFSNRKRGDDEMDVDSGDEEGGKAARKMKAGSGMNRSRSGSIKNQRKGLGAVKGGAPGGGKVVKSKSPKMKARSVFGGWKGPA
jgi:ribosomal RNA-processing protein 12